MKVYRLRDINVYVMYYVYVTSGPSLLIESTDSMILINTCTLTATIHAVPLYL